MRGYHVVFLCVQCLNKLRRDWTIHGSTIPADKLELETMVSVCLIRTSRSKNCLRSEAKIKMFINSKSSIVIRTGRPNAEGNVKFEPQVYCSCAPCFSRNSGSVNAHTARPGANGRSRDKPGFPYRPERGCWSSGRVRRGCLPGGRKGPGLFWKDHRA